MKPPPDLPLPVVGAVVLMVASIAHTATTPTTTTTRTAATSTPPASFPPASSTASPPSSSVWTFSQPGTSRISFTPPLSDTGVQRLQFQFRTVHSNGLLVRHYLQEYDPEEHARLSHYELFAEIRQGGLRVGHVFNRYQDTVNIGRAVAVLNNDRWHKLEVVLNQTRGELVVTLDNNSMTQPLKAYLWGNAKDILQWSQLQSTVSFGDTQASTFGTVPFVGCLKELYYSLDSAILSPVPLQLIEGVTPGCVDQCQAGAQCVNNGRCVNLYTGFHCDCFGMDYEGERCEKKGPSVLTFSGYEWVTYRLYDGDDNRHFADSNRVSLEFKTERPSGILLYAVGSSPYHNHITAAIHTGVLHVSLAFGSDDLDFPIGIGLDDNRWHNLTIDHRGRTVNVYLDGDLHSKQIKNPDVFLSLDPLAYFGGGDNFVLTRGLPVTRNFIGCMKNVYFNDQSVLYQLSNNSVSARYHGGEKPTFGCSPVQDIPISFPNAASMLRWSKGQRGENLTVEFNFRTVRKNSIMLYVELLSRRDGGGGYNYGVMEVWVRDGRPMLVFIPSSQNGESAENLTLPITVNDAKWHSMQITLQLSQAKLRVDTVTKSTMRYKKFIEHRGQVMLGVGLGRYKQTEGYVGCMEKIVIQGLKLDPISIVETEGAVGLILDGCFLIDHCSINNICEHSSECLSDWDGVQCLCEDNSYEGKACHFPEYMTTCDDYYQAGYTKSGTYMIDMDGTGPQGPTYVDCQMGAERDGMMYGAVVVEHNFATNMAVRGPLLEDRQYQLTYREMDHSETLELTRVSSMCEQYFKYQCTEAPIQLGKKTWFKAANGAVVDYLGSAKPGFCSCPDGDLCNEERCYCDAGEATLTMDEGYSRTKQRLPIIEMTFLQTTRSGRANMTLGPLVCWGSETQPLERSVTMTTESSYLELPAWRHGELRLRFKTHQDRALLILQSTSGSPHTGDMFTLKIISALEVEFHFRVNETLFTERLSVPRPLNQGDWHYVSIEFDPYDVRLGLDTVRKLYPFSLAPKSGQLHFTGMIYIGGLPNEIADKYSERTPGFTGCLRPLVINDETVDLSHNVHANWTGISTGCKSSCWPNPCEHGGTCKEEWGDYTCLCQDPWAHQGRNCEHNLNQDAVTFSGETTSFLKFDMTQYQYNGILDTTIVLSFRTIQSEALLLYAHDQMSNFVQMELQQGNTIVFTYNSYNAIVRGSITAPDKLNDGEWKQVIAQEYYNLTKLIMGEQSTIIEFKRVKLNTYSMDPFEKSIQPETVFIPRTYKQPEPFVHLYVGGMGEEGTTSTPHLKGCVRGMRFGRVPINLGDGVRARGNTTDLTAACENGCSTDTCLNNGYCYEHWQHGNFTCDCSESDYSGIHCEKEASVWLDGQSVVQHQFQLPLSAQRTITERALLHFRTSGTSALNAQGQRMDMVLFYITSSASGDYILARLDSDGNALIETNQGVGIYRMKVSGNFANGELHEMEYTREGTNMYLTLDGVKEASIVYPDYDLDKINTILIGGLLPEQTDFENTANFTGCISNTVFMPEANLPLKIRSLKELYLDNSVVTVFGPQVNSCTAAMLVGKTVTVGPLVFPRTTPSQLLTMPVWDVGPAQVVTLSPPIVSTEAPTTSPKPTPITNSTQAMLASSKGDNVDDLTVIIAVSVIGGILFITIIVAVLLFRKRRRHYEFKKEEIELKQPLNSYHVVNSVPASPVPNDHLAKLDEFSMITALLGPRTVATNGDVPHNNINRHSQGSFTKPEETTEFLNPIFNKRKQRPASSISEVLEELERRQQAQSTGNTSSTEDIVGRPHGEGELEWDPQADRTPLTYEDITFFNTPLLAPILDENEDSHVSSLALSEQKSDTQEKPEDSSPSADESHTNQNSLLDGNGDSGYEAESRPEMTTEEDVTPTADDDRMLHEEEEEDGDEETNAKLYMYNISNIDSEDSPILSAPNTRLLKRKNKDT